MQDLIPEIVKRLDKLQRGFDSPDVDTKKELHNLFLWLLSGRSVQQHRLFWKFIFWLYNSYGQDYANEVNFKDELLRQTGFCDEIKRHGTLKDGTKFKVINFRAHSVAFGKCSQRKFNKIFDAIKNFAASQWGVNFDEWEAEYKNNEHLM